MPSMDNGLLTQPVGHHSIKMSAINVASGPTSKYSIEDQKILIKSINQKDGLKLKTRKSYLDAKVR